MTKVAIVLLIFIIYTNVALANENIKIDSINESSKLLNIKKKSSSFIKFEADATMSITYHKVIDERQFVFRLRTRLFNFISFEGGLGILNETTGYYGINFHINDFSISLLNSSIADKAQFENSGGLWLGYMPINSLDNFDFYFRLGIILSDRIPETNEGPSIHTLGLNFGLKYNIN